MSRGGVGREREESERKGGRMRNEETGRNLSSQTGTKASRRETYQSEKKRDAIVKVLARCSVCVSVCVCAFRHTGRSWGRSSTLKGGFMS